MFDSISQDINNIKKLITEEILNNKYINFTNRHFNTEELNNILEYYLAQTGKLLRPSLIICIEKLINNNNNNNKHYLLAILTELMHGASLLHDDVIDNSAMRRNQETVNSKWSNKYAIITGDYLFSLASYYLSYIENHQVSKLYAELLLSLCQGEMIQAENLYNINNINWPVYIQKSRLKTAILFSHACQSSAILATENQDYIKAIYNYGDNLGIAFQIIDDILDFTADENILGKPNLADIHNGIYTAPVLIVLDSEYKEQFMNLLPQKNTYMSEQNKKELYDILEKTHAIEKSYEKAKEYAHNALNSLNIFTESIYKNHLIELIELTLTRQK